ncbi:neuronal acetylcholine receptor subunit alpha-7-like [Gigantopelta aegis]|uniref:neuronal acetylcholine receptor subunit alpha-7-like n=1 Tax=Gigantopelta aegis TaxID=1735272 RepID=UPI001B889D80|nr:neuronal acetylcholine receptor subunit alpha-7-like [Gigantopelta aegis]
MYLSVNLKITCFLLLQITLSRCQLSSDVQQVYMDIVETNNPRIRPVQQQTTTTKVYMKYFLSSINGYAESSQTLKTSGYLELVWQDEFLTWNASLYGGAYHIKPDLKNIWRPSISVKNAVDFKEIFSPEYSVNVYNTGMVVWYPGDDIETYCSMDVTMFPFDTQTCRIEFFISSDAAAAVDLYPRIDSIALDAFKKSNEWELVNTTAVREIRLYSNFEFSFVVVSMTLDRKTSGLILSVLLSVFIQAFLNIFVFVVSAESGEKISFSITGLLTYTVLLSFVTEELPKTADTTSILAVFVGAMTGLNAIYVFLAIISLRLFHRDASVHPVPTWCVRLVLFFQWRVKTDTKLDETTETSWQKSLTSPLKWKHVSRTLDNICFCVFILGLLTTVCVLFGRYM